MYGFFNIQNIEEIVLPIIRQQTKISLRLLDWLVTNYAKKYDVSYHLSRDSHGLPISLYESYKVQLKRYGKKLFDPFRRKSRVYFYYSDHAQPEIVEPTDIGSDSDDSLEAPPLPGKRGFVTTPGQLNFFKFAIEEEVLRYAFTHCDAIEKDMMESSKAKKENPNERRSPLARNSPSVCQMYRVQMAVDLS